MWKTDKKAIADWLPERNFTNDFPAGMRICIFGQLKTVRKNRFYVNEKMNKYSSWLFYLLTSTASTVAGGWQQKARFTTRRMTEITFPLITRRLIRSAFPLVWHGWRTRATRVSSHAAIDTSAICHVKLHSSGGRFMRYTTDASAKRMATI